MLKKTTIILPDDTQRATSELSSELPNRTPTNHFWLQIKAWRPKCDHGSTEKYDFIIIKLFVFTFLLFSAATLPTTIRCVEENNKIDRRISRFMLPLGATLNMDGLALSRVIVTIFVAQLNDIYLSPGRVVVAW